MEKVKDIDDNNNNEKTIIKDIDKQTINNNNDNASILDPRQREATKILIQLANEKRAQLKAQRFAKELFNENSEAARNNPILQKVIKDARLEERTYKKMLKEKMSKGPIETIIGPLNYWQFDEKHIDKNLVWVLTGKRRTGKSHLLREIIYRFYRSVNFFMVLSTTSFNQYWQEIVPPIFVHEGWKPEVIDALLKRQRSLVTKTAEKYKISAAAAAKHPDVRMVMILDDIVAEKYKVRANKFLAEIAVAGRHYGITLFITTQYINSISTDLRGNTDILISFTQTQDAQKEAIINNFLNFSTKEVGYKLLEEVAVESHKGGEDLQADDKSEDTGGKGSNILESKRKPKPINNTKKQKKITKQANKKPEKIVSVLVVNLWTNSSNPLYSLSWYAADSYCPPFKVGLKEYWEKSKHYKILNSDSGFNIDDYINRVGIN